MPRRTMLADRLKSLMDREDVTQRELARAIGTTQATVSLWLSGDREPGLRFACELADHFGVTLDYLTGRFP